MKRHTGWIGKTSGGVVVATLVLAAGCAKQPTVDRDMATHFEEASLVHAAVVFGDLDRARSAARSLARHTEAEDLPDGSEPWVDQMERAALKISDAWNLEAAAQGSAELAAACGSCHRAFDAGPQVRVAWQPEVAPGVGPHMDRHHWAMDRLWDGLMVPSDEWWFEGAEVLRDDPLEAEALHGIAGSEGEELGRRVHELGHVARGVEDPTIRIDMYADILTTCVQCHEMSRDIEGR